MSELTFDSLMSGFRSYIERNDSAFLGQRENFIMLAENKVAAELKNQGFQTVVRGSLPLEDSMPKPAFWRSSISFYITVNGSKQPVYLRSLEYINEATLDLPAGPPQFYGDYNAKNFKLGPVADQDYSFELLYYARLEPLSEANQTNWMTVNIPQVILSAAMLQAAIWSGDEGKIARWKGEYAEAGNGILSENQERIVDRNTVVSRG